MNYQREAIAKARIVPAEVLSPANRLEPHEGAPDARADPLLGTTLGTSAPSAGPAGLYFTVGEVARRLRVSTATVYSLCRRGELNHYRVSNAIRIPERALTHYLSG